MESINTGHIKHIHTHRITENKESIVHGASSIIYKIIIKNEIGSISYLIIEKMGTISKTPNETIRMHE